MRVKLLMIALKVGEPTKVTAPGWVQLLDVDVPNGDFADVALLVPEPVEPKMGEDGRLIPPPEVSFNLMLAAPGTEVKEGWYYVSPIRSAPRWTTDRLFAFVDDPSVLDKLDMYGHIRGLRDELMGEQTDD